VFLAGAGNATVVTSLAKDESPRLQCRALHMLLAFNVPVALFAHYLVGAGRPRFTVTSCTCARGGYVWYIGGELAANGIDLPRNHLVALAQRELAAHLPWVPHTSFHWRTLRASRHELGCVAGELAEEPVTLHGSNWCMGWPSKLVVASQLADAIVYRIAGRSKRQDFNPRQFSRPPIAAPVWRSRAKNEWSL
jgi:hypothetical protein